VSVKANTVFVRMNPDDEEMHVPAYFSTLPKDIEDSTDIDLDSIQQELHAAADNWNGRGSGFVLDHIVKLVLSVTVNRPLHGTSYIVTPPFFANKHCCVNVHNTDNHCFVWAILSCMFPADEHTDRISLYRITCPL